MNNEIETPKYLRSTYNMLYKAYPNGIPENDYYPLLTLLYDFMGNRNLATVISIISGKDYGITLNDSYGAGGYKIPIEDVERVKNKLIQCGYIEWTQEEE